MKKSSNFKYFVSEGCKSYSKNWLMSLASTFIVVASLLVLGVYLLFSMNVNYIAEQFKSECEISAYIDSSVEAESDEMQDIENHIKAISNVDDIDFYSKEKALVDYREDLGEEAGVLDGLEDDNPLRDSFKITLVDLEQAGKTADEIEKIEGVAKVSDNQTSMSKLISATNIIKSISFWFMIFLSAIAVFIISNTIKITLFARRRDINIMKYLGATNSFISWPYIIEGIVIGIVGAVVSLAVVVLVYSYFLAQNFMLIGSIDFCELKDVLLPLTAWFAGIGILLGAVGSAVSIRRHLRV